MNRSYGEMGLSRRISPIVAPTLAILPADILAEPKTSALGPVEAANMNACDDTMVVGSIKRMGLICERRAFVNNLDRSRGQAGESHLQFKRELFQNRHQNG